MADLIKRVDVLKAWRRRLPQASWYNVTVERIEVVPAQPTERRPIPHEGCPRHVAVGEETDDRRGSRRCNEGRESGIRPVHGPFRVGPSEVDDG